MRVQSITLVDTYLLNAVSYRNHFKFFILRENGTHEALYVKGHTCRFFCHNIEKRMNCHKSLTERVAMEAQRNNLGGTNFVPFDHTVNSKELSTKLERITRVKSVDGTFLSFNVNELRASIDWACQKHVQHVSADLILQEVINTIFDGISVKELADALIMASSSFIEVDPSYNYVAAQLLLKKLFKEITGSTIRSHAYDNLYRQSFITSIKEGVAAKTLDPRLLEFDLEKLAAHLSLERDLLFEYMGLKTLMSAILIKLKSAGWSCRKHFGCA